MNANKILTNDNFSIKQKINFLKKEQDENLQMFIDYYAGVHDIEFRQHPNDKSKNNKINKIVINLIRKIVNYNASFTFGKDVLLSNQDELYNAEFQLFNDNWKDAKLKSHYNEVAKELLAYGQVAEIIYQKEDLKVRNQILSVKNNKLSANFNEKGELDCFIREYKITEVVGTKIKEVPIVELYTNSYKATFQVINNDYIPIGEPELYDKMPIIYYTIEEPIWLQIKKIQDRINLNKSVNADVIDVYSFPLLILKGLLVENDKGETIVDLFSKGKSSAKLLQFDTQDGQSGEATYLQQKGADESYTNEYNSLINIALYLTSTPNMSFENLKTIGNLSGVALTLMFTESLTLSEELKNALFNLTRAINLHKHLFSKMYNNAKFEKMRVDVIFQNTIPTNETELIENIKKAVEGGFLSIETAVSLNPLVKNSESEIEKILNDRVQDFAESYN